MENLDEKVISFMESNNITPFFSLTPQQQRVFGSSIHDKRELMAVVTSRIIQGDPWIGVPTNDQRVFAEKIKQMMGL